MQESNWCQYISRASFYLRGLLGVSLNFMLFLNFLFELHAVVLKNWFWKSKKNLTLAHCSMSLWYSGHGLWLLHRRNADEKEIQQLKTAFLNNFCDYHLVK